ncbi:hypothetical protein BC628DRAFT_1358670 [Trametes gibbosa]|nr:hypothetical protein BC628DRAFT_1358670 [Trametes gibbosa]
MRLIDSCGRVERASRRDAGNGRPRTVSQPTTVGDSEVSACFATFSQVRCGSRNAGMDVRALIGSWCQLKIANHWGVMHAGCCGASAREGMAKLSMSRTCRLRTGGPEDIVMVGNATAAVELLRPEPESARGRCRTLGKTFRQKVRFELSVGYPSKLVGKRGPHVQTAARGSW